MSGIKWLTCPKCAYRFYIVDEHANQGFEWFCPKCKHTFDEEAALAASPAKARS
jgi:ribosomal protein L37AE/L43A